MWWIPGFAIIAAAIGFVIRGSVRSWKQQTMARLEAGSRIAQTALGPVEYGIARAERLKTAVPVLAIHGAPGGYDQGLVAGAHGFPDRAVIGVSRPGYLRTPLTSGKSPQAQADLFAALLDTLGIDRVIALGMSGGGPSALEFALRHPQRVAALVLVSAVTGSLEDEVNINRLMASDTAAWLQLSLLRRFPRTLLGKVLAADAHLLPVLLPLAESSFPLDQRIAGWRNDVEQFRAQNPPLDAIQPPTLILHGSVDDAVPLVSAQQAARRIPGAELQVIEGADHISAGLTAAALEYIRAFVHQQGL